VGTDGQILWLSVPLFFQGKDVVHVKTASKWYVAGVSAVGLIVGLYCAYILFTAQIGMWNGETIGRMITLTILCVLCRCLPLYIREDCTVDLSFLSILAAVLVLGPEAAVTMVFITTPLEIIPTEDGKGYYHILNTAPVKTFFNMGNRNISFYAGGLAYYAAGGVPGKIGLPSILPAILAFLLCALVLNSSILTGCFRLQGICRVNPTIFQMLWGLVPSILCTVPVGYFISFLLLRSSGPWLTMLFVLPLLLARFSFKLYLDSQHQHINIIRTLAAAIDAKDHYTRGHSQRVSVYSARIARRMGLSSKRTDRLQLAALFHDIGKIAVPDEILNKRGWLTQEERARIQNHPRDGVRILENMDSYTELYPYILHHHEFYNGHGYPDGTAGDDLPVDIYILSAADAYDAITSDRPYHKGVSPQKAAEIMLEESGKQFHPEVARTVAAMAADGSIFEPIPADSWSEDPDREPVSTC
jgi:putative nucleotidyltransferase with HDIG domain